MKYRNHVIWIVMLLLCAGALDIGAQGRAAMTIGINRIQGRIIDQSNIGVYNAIVELYDNYGGLVSRQRSTGGGRYEFKGMGPGRYVVSVKPFGTNLQEQSQDVEVINQSARSDLVTADFRLMPDRRFQAPDPGVVGTIFVQEVPSEAERLYKSGIDSLGSRPDKAFADLEQAVRLFPTYFNALAALGKAYIIKGKYDTGYPYLLRAIDINRKCSDCYYSLALAFYRLNELPAATKAIDATVVLQARTPAVRLLQGMIYRLNGDLAGAEKALLTAKSLYKETDPEVHWQLSLVYNRLKRNQDAANELELYLKAKSDMSDADRKKVEDLIVKLRKST